MKKKKTKLLWGRIIFVFILIIILITSAFILLKPKELKEEEKQETIEITPTQKTNFNNEVINKENLEEQLEIKIINFLNQYYHAMSQLEIVDMTKLFETKNESAIIYQTTIDLLVELRSLKHVDLRLSDGYYNLEITEVTKTNNEITVTVLEDSYINFMFMHDTTTEIHNVENTFVFDSETYELLEYSKGQDFYVLVTDKYDDGGQEELDEIKTDYLKQTKEIVSDLKEDYNYVLENGITSTKTCDYEYNREEALNYAHEYYTKRNEQWYTFGSNCQNYASQVLIAGGIAMDYKGDAEEQLQWKFYDGSYNLKEEQKGYNYTWTYVPYFYEYAKNNEGLGLCATVDENIYFAEAGDVIQLGTKWYDRHTVVVVGQYEKDGIIQDILLNSNSVDLKNFPLSAYTYPYARLIKVHGYND